MGARAKVEVEVGVGVEARVKVAVGVEVELKVGVQGRDDSMEAATFCQLPSAMPSKRATSKHPASSEQKRRCALPSSSDLASIWIVSCAAPDRCSRYLPESVVPFKGWSDCSITVPLYSRLR